MFILIGAVILSVLVAGGGLILFLMGVVFGCSDSTLKKAGIIWFLLILVFGLVYTVVNLISVLQYF